MNRIEHIKRHRPTLRITLLIAVGFVLFGQATTAMAQNTFPGPVGIGTTSPVVQLHVLGTSTTQARIETTGTAGVAIDFKNPSRRWAIGTGLLTAGGDFSIYDGNAAATRMYFDTNGNAGIGTTAPTAPLQVVGNEPSTDYATLRVKPTVTHGGIVIDSANDSSQAHLRFFRNGVPKWQFRVPFQDNTEDLRLFSWAANADVMSITTGGSVGIGTTTPNAALQIKAQNIPYRGQLSLEATDHAQITFYSGPTTQTNLKGHIYYQMANNQFVINNFAGGPLILNPGVGEGVGIGTLTPTPTAKLDVNGNVNVTGNITATGNIAAKYQDVAEWVEAAHLMPAGTVVILNPQKSNQVMASAQAYDTKVAGVVSAQPGIALGEGGAGKVLVATTGRVKVKVDATGAPIHIGDLLVTSDKEGLAMKSEPILIGRRQIHAPGTLIGKALEPLEKGTGEILVLLSLQ